MRSLTESIYESIIAEAWAERRNYAKELEEIFNAYTKKKERVAKRRNGPSFRREIDTPEAKLAKYPMQILIDKAGYTPKEITQWNYRAGQRVSKQVPSKDHYGAFIAQEIESGNLKKEDMIKWWEEYDETVARNNWHDPKYIVKQLDVTRLWNPYSPKDDSLVQELTEKPEVLARYIAPRRATWEEREEFRAFLSDPANQDALKAALKTIKNAINRAKPTFEVGVMKNVQSLIDSCEYNGGDIQSLMAAEYASARAPRYEGANDKDCEASAVIGLILKAINELYGFGLWSSIDKASEDDDVSANVYVRSDAEERTLEGFLDDAPYLKVCVNKLKPSDKKRSSGVYASSFSTYYDYDFEVVVLKDKEEIYRKKFEQVTIGSYFYSGGW